MKPLKLSAHALLLAAASAVPFAAMAQDAPDQEAEEQDEVKIVVTGSRIAVDPNVGSPSPVIAVTGETLQQAGTADVVDTLRDIPALSTSTSTEGSIDGVFSFAVGQATLNLRGLGAGRTLVLVNGRRHVSGVAGSQVVDVNSIPTALIERVETLTGGASSIYGADAVTGVVNFVLRDDFEGIEANIQSGISSKGDSWRINGDLTWGTNFADGRGNFVVSGEYAYNDELSFGERAFSRNNGLFDDLPNPALRFQTGELNAANTPNFIANGEVIGGLIPTSATGFTPTTAEQALIDRSVNAARRLIASDPRFSLSSAGGVIAPGDIGLSDGPDINRNGIPDCLESAVGFNSTFNDGAFGLAGGCAVINADGSLSVYQDGAIAGLFNQFGGNGIQNNFNNDSLIPESERWSINANLTYEISSEATLFFEGKYVSNRAENQSELNTFYDLLTIRADNPFITAQQRQYVAPLFFGNGTDEGFYITRDPTDLGPNRDRNEFETWRFVGGVRGDITDHFSYEIAANYGKSTQRSFDGNRVITDRWFAAIDAVQGPNGPICRSDINPTPPATTPFGIPAGDPGFFTFNPGDGQCKPANILGGIGAISQEAIDFITTTTLNEFTLEQFVVSAIFTGDTGAFFELPGGAVGFAGGFELREEQSTSNFDPLILGIIPVTTAFGNAGDFVGDATGGVQNSLVFDPATTTRNAGGEFTVYELFGEVRLPILAAVPWAETLELSGAARFANYSTAGSNLTWNVSGLYAPSEDILFRGTYAKAVRAPNINELFNPAQGAFFRPDDPCDAGNLVTADDPALRQANCTAFFNSIGFDPTFGTGKYSYVDPLTARFSGSISGNPALDVETATTWTVGAQITPRWVPGLIFSVDYYNIEIEDAINAVGAQDIVDNCVDSATINNGFCDLISRNPLTGGFTFLRQTSVNFARQETSGVEFSGQYRFDIGEHNFTLGASGTWVEKLNNFFDPADPTLVDPELGELQRPEWAGRGFFTWDWNNLSVTWGTTYLDSMGLRAVEIETVGNTGTDTYTPANGLTNETFIHDITFSYDVNDMFRVYGGVNNVFNENPFVTEQAYPVSPVGTLFFLGVRASM